MDKKYLRQEEVSKVYGLSDSWLRKARVVGNGPVFVKAGRVVLYEVEAVESYLKKNEVHSTSEFTVGKGMA